MDYYREIGACNVAPNQSTEIQIEVEDIDNFSELDSDEES